MAGPVGEARHIDGVRIRHAGARGVGRAGDEVERCRGGARLCGKDNAAAVSTVLVRQERVGRKRRVGKGAANLQRPLEVPQALPSGDAGEVGSLRGKSKLKGDGLRRVDALHGPSSLDEANEQGAGQCREEKVVHGEGVGRRRKLSLR